MLSQDWVFPHAFTSEVVTSEVDALEVFTLNVVTSEVDALNVFILNVVTLEVINSEAATLEVDA